MTKGLNKAALSILMVFVLLGCEVHVQTEVRSGDDESADVVSNQEGANDSSTAPETVPSGPPSSVEEVEAIRAAIAETLQASSEPWGAEMADRTRNAPCELDADGTAHIGSWTLAPCAEDCNEQQSIRFLWREEGRQVPSYAAEVERQGNGFRCTNLGQFLVVQ